METSKQILKARNDFEWGVPSKSQKGVVHCVGFSQAKDKWTCDCIAGLMGNELCRHIRQIQHEVKGITWTNE